MTPVRIKSRRTTSRWIAGIAIVACAAGVAHAQSKAAKPSPADVARGKYVAQIAGCNDCHTPGYAMSGGKADDKVMLTGDALGWRGPWGTTYPANLRLVVADLTEDQWLKHARVERRPPMPWFALRYMSDADVRALYRYIRSLGPGGQPAPAYVRPDKTPNGPFVQFPAPPK